MSDDPRTRKRAGIFIALRKSGGGRGGVCDLVSRDAHSRRRVVCADGGRGACARGLLCRAARCSCVAVRASFYEPGRCRSRRILRQLEGRARRDRAACRRDAHCNSGESSRCDLCCRYRRAGMQRSRSGDSVDEEMHRASSPRSSQCLCARRSPPFSRPSRNQAGAATNATSCSHLRMRSAQRRDLRSHRSRTSPRRAEWPTSLRYVCADRHGRAHRLWLRSDGDDAIDVRRTGCRIRSRRATRDARRVMNGPSNRSCRHGTQPSPGIASPRDAAPRQRRPAPTAMHDRPRRTSVPAPRDARVAPMAQRQPAVPSYAAFNAATSNFVICIIAAATRAALISSRSAIIGISASGTICHETP